MIATIVLYCIFITIIVWMEVLIDQPYIKFPPPQPLPVLQPKPYRHQQIRFLVLTLLSTVLLANEYTFNNPQALQLSI